MENENEIFDIITLVKGIKPRCHENESAFLAVLNQALREKGWNHDFYSIGLTFIGENRKRTRNLDLYYSDPNLCIDIALQFFCLSFLINRDNWLSLYEIAATLIDDCQFGDAIKILRYLDKNNKNFTENICMNIQKCLGISLFYSEKFDEAGDILLKLKIKYPADSEVSKHLFWCSLRRRENQG